MAVLSPGLQLAWHIAATEAAIGRYEFIEREHLFIGICKVGNPSGEAGGAKRDASPEQITALRTEAMALESLFSELRLERVGLYRELRQRIGRGNADSRKQDKLGRSPRSKTAFERAEKLATGAPAVNVLHLLAALLEEGQGAIHSLLAERGVEASAIKAAALKSASTSALSPKMKRELPLEIAATFDATVSSFEPGGAHNTQHLRRLSLLYELPLHFARAATLDALLQVLVEKLLEVIPGAKRGAVLLAEPENNRLVLKAHLPFAEPAVSMTLAHRALTRREGFVWQEGQNEEIPDASLQRIGTGMYAPLLSRESVLGIVCVDNPNRDMTFSKEDLRLLVAVAHYGALAVAHQRAMEDLRCHADLTNRLFASRFAPSAREKLMRAAATGALPIGTTQSFVTILICDIRRFTALTAKLGPQRTGDLLNDYFPRLIDCIHANDGSVERLAGDGMFAVFGSPNPDPEQQVHAVCAALEMQAVSESLMRTRAARKAETCGIGIGIDCGQALHGFIGNADRLGYAVIGDPANQASRYCSGAAEGEILISPEVHARVFNRIRTERVEITTKDGVSLGAFRVKGLC